MRRPLGRRSVAIPLAILIATLAGCAAEDRVAPNDLIGEHLDALTSELSVDTLLLVQDVSTLIGVDPSYDANDDGSGWTIVAACADAADVFEATAVEVAVVSAVDPPSDLDERIDEGEFEDAVSCDDGRTFR